MSCTAPRCSHTTQCVRSVSTSPPRGDPVSWSTARVQVTSGRQKNVACIGGVLPRYKPGLLTWLDPSTACPHLLCRRAWCESLHQFFICCSCLFGATSFSCLFVVATLLGHIVFVPHIVVLSHAHFSKNAAPRCPHTTQWVRSVSTSPPRGDPG